MAALLDRGKHRGALIPLLHVGVVALQLLLGGASEETKLRLVVIIARQGLLVQSYRHHLRLLIMDRRLPARMVGKTVVETLAHKRLQRVVYIRVAVSILQGVGHADSHIRYRAVIRENVFGVRFARWDGPGFVCVTFVYGTDFGVLGGGWTAGTGRSLCRGNLFDKVSLLIVISRPFNRRPDHVHTLRQTTHLLNTFVHLHRRFDHLLPHICAILVARRFLKPAHYFGLPQIRLSFWLFVFDFLGGEADSGDVDFLLFWLLRTGHLFNQKA